MPDPVPVPISTTPPPSPPVAPAAAPAAAVPAGDATDPAAALLAVRASLHDLMNLLQPVVGLAELLALRPAVANDAVAAAQARDLIAAGEAAIARVNDLRRLTAAPRAGGTHLAAAPAGGAGAPPGDGAAVRGRRG